MTRLSRRCATGIVAVALWAAPARPDDATIVQGVVGGSEFAPTADGSRMDYTVAVTDPVNFMKPVTLNRYFLDLGETIVPYKCNERK